MKKFLFMCVGMVVLAFASAASVSASNQHPQFTGSQFCVGASTVTSTNVLQDLLLATAATLHLQVKTDVLYGPFAPYRIVGPRDKGLDVAKGACPMVAQPLSSAFFCTYHDNRQMIVIGAADIPRVLKQTWPDGSPLYFKPVAVPVPKGASIVVNSGNPNGNTIIGNASQKWQLLCGGVPGTSGSIDKVGSFAAFGSWTAAQPDFYPLGTL